MTDCVCEKDYADKKICIALKHHECDNCSFYMSQEDAQEKQKKINARLESLPDKQQSIISEKYYSGKMPWKEV